MVVASGISFAGLLLMGIPLAVVVLGAFCLWPWMYKRYLRIGFAPALGLALLAVLGVAAAVAWKAYSVRMGIHGSFGPYHGGARVRSLEVWEVLGCLWPLFALPFVVRLYQAWVMQRLTDAERLPDMTGVRAWLSAGNLVCALGISACAWLGYGYSFWGVLAMTLIAILAYPVVNMLSSHHVPVSSQSSTELTDERQRILRLLEEGRITADESAELLSALGETVQPVSLPAAATSKHRKLMLLGAAAALIGFFLPWLSINPGRELSRAMSILSLPMPAPMQGMPQLPAMPTEISGLPMNPSSTSSFRWTTGTVHVTGGELSHGLGWFILVLGLAAALLPYVATTLNRQTQRTATFLMLGAGLLILLFVLTTHLRRTDVGLVVVMAGYALEWIGAVKEYRSVGAIPAVAVGAV